MPTITATAHQAATSNPAGIVASFKSWRRSLNNRLEHDRLGVPWWQLALAWCLLIGSLYFSTRYDSHQVFYVLVGGMAYIWYFWPSLSWFGVTLTPIATLVACFIAIVSNAPAEPTLPTSGRSHCVLE